MDTETTSDTVQDQPSAGETLLAVLSGADPASPAVIVPEQGLVLTFEALSERVNRFAGALGGLGVGRGDRVALALGPGLQFLESLFGTLAVGAAAAPLNPAYTAAEFHFYLDDVAPQLLVLPAGGMAAAREAAASLPAVLLAELADAQDGPGLSVGGTAPAPGGIAGPLPDDVALLLHTSGTTSRPKQVPLLHRNLMASVRAIANAYELGSDDVSYCLMPLFHVHGLVASVWAALAAGGQAVLPSRLSGRGFWTTLGEHGVTWFSASPTIHQMMLDQHGSLPKRSRLRFVRSCSAALPPELERRLEETFGVPVVQAYGMTEASHQISSNPLPPAARFSGSVGLPTGTEIKVVDDDGSEVPDGEPGHVLVRGASVTPGYLNGPEANAESFVDGWFRTGDLGFRDANCYLHLTGRAKELIIRGGENISPHEIEESLLAHPAIIEAVCFAIPDEKYGEEVGAAVAARDPVDERQLRDFCRTRLASFKVPKTIYVLDALPRTATGKLQRRRMYALLTEEAHD